MKESLGIENQEKQSQQKECSKKIIKMIEDALDFPEKEIPQKINMIAKKVLTIKNISDETKQKIIFDEVCIFLNSIFKNGKIRKLYNTIPYTNIVEYSNKSLGEQFRHNIYKDNKIEKKETIGASCHHRSILIKQIFDTLQEQGIACASSISTVDQIGGHSCVIIKFKGKKYIADISDEEYGSKHIIHIVRSDIPVQGRVGSLSNMKEDIETKKFDSTHEFAKYINQRETQKATIEFKEYKSKKKIRFEFAKGYFSIIIEDIIHKYRINKREAEPIQNTEDFIKHIIANEKDLIIIKKLIQQIEDKIDVKKLIELYK